MFINQKSEVEIKDKCSKLYGAGSPGKFYIQSETSLNLSRL